MIEPLFTAKQQYGLELAVDITKAEADTGLCSLHIVHQAATKAILSIPTREHPEDEHLLLQQTQQTSDLGPPTSVLSLTSPRLSQGLWRHVKSYQLRFAKRRGSQPSSERTGPVTAEISEPVFDLRTFTVYFIFQRYCLIDF
jgi:hypothetical protein